MEATLAVPEQLSCPRLSPSLLSGMLLPLHDGNPIFLPPPPHAAATRTHASNAHAMAVYYEIIGPDAAPPFARAFNIKEIELDESRWLSIHVMIISLPEIHPPNCTRAP